MKILKIGTNAAKNIINSGTQIKSNLVKPKDLRMNILKASPDDAWDAASNLTLDGFVDDAYKLIKSASIFDNKTLPKLSFSMLPPHYKAMYMINNNEILVNSDLGRITKPKMFEVLAHELRHSEQIFNGLRLDKHYPENLDKIAEFAAKADKMTYSELTRKNTPETITRLFKEGKISENLYNLAMEGCEIYDKHPELYDKFTLDAFKKISQNKYLQWENIQNQIIDTVGMIPSDSKAGIYFEKIFNSAMEENKVNLGYFFKPHERDAYMSGVRATSEFKKLIREYFKNNF